VWGEIHCEEEEEEEEVDELAALLVDNNSNDEKAGRRRGEIDDGVEEEGGDDDSSAASLSLLGQDIISDEGSSETDEKLTPVPTPPPPPNHNNNTAAAVTPSSPFDKLLNLPPTASPSVSLPFGGGARLADKRGAVIASGDGCLYHLDEGGGTVKVFKGERPDFNKPGEVHLIEDERTPSKIRRVAREFSDFFVKEANLI